MGFVALEDGTDTVECVFFADPWGASLRAIQADKPLLVRGKLERKGDDIKIIADSVELLSDVRERRTRRVSIYLNHEDITAERTERLSALLKESSGTCVTRLYINVPDVGQVSLKLSEEFSTLPEDQLVDGLSAIFARGDLVRFT